jgi:hypothetical protein
MSSAWCGTYDTPVVSKEQEIFDRLLKLPGADINELNERGESLLQV